MRILVFEDVSGVGAFVVIQVRGDFAGGEGFGRVVLGMSVIVGVSVIVGMSVILGMGLGLGCHVRLDGIGGVLRVLHLGINGACGFLNLSIGGLLQRFLYGFG